MFFAICAPIMNIFWNEQQHIFIAHVAATRLRTGIWHCPQTLICLSLWCVHCMMHCCASSDIYTQLYRCPSEGGWLPGNVTANHLRQSCCTLKGLAVSVMNWIHASEAPPVRRHSHWHRGTHALPQAPPIRERWSLHHCAFPKAPPGRWRLCLCHCAVPEAPPGRWRSPCALEIHQPSDNSCRVPLLVGGQRGGAKRSRRPSKPMKQQHGFPAPSVHRRCCGKPCI